MMIAQLKTLRETLNEMPVTLRQEVDGWQYYVEQEFLSSNSPNPIIRDADIIIFYGSPSHVKKSWEQRKTDIENGGLNELHQFLKREKSLREKVTFFSCLSSPMRGLDRLKISDLPKVLQKKLKETANKYNIEISEYNLLFIFKEFVTIIGSQPVIYREYFHKTKKFGSTFSFSDRSEDRHEIKRPMLS